MSKANSASNSLHGDMLPMPEEALLDENRQPFIEQSQASNNATSVSEQKNFPRALKINHLRLLAKKRQEIAEVQKLVTHQQSLYMNLYAQIKDIEIRAGVDSGDKIGKMRFLTMKGWPPHDLLMLVKQNSASKPYGYKGELGPAVLKQLRAELSSIPQEFSALAKDIMARRLKVIDPSRRRMTDSKSQCEFDKETTEIQKIVSDTCKNLEMKVTRILELAETSWKDREDLIAKINSLNKELSQIEAKITNEAKKESNPEEKIPSTKSPETSITDLKDKLNKERAARESLKHMVETAEGLLRKARMRITVLERELKTTQKQMQATARKQHEYELLHRCRETSFGVRSKKLLEESKTGEGTIDMLSLQRDALELRVKELQEQVRTIVADYESRESKHQTTIHRLQDKAEEQAQHRVAAESRASELEKRIKQLHEQYQQLFEKSSNLVKMNSEKCLDYLPRKENEPSLNETELWKELQATKKRLEETTEELRQSRADKDSLLNSLAKIAHEGSRTNMGNELLLREQKNFRLQQDLEELKQDVKSKNAVIAQKDRLIITLRMEGSRADYECCEETSQQDLSLEIMELTDRVATLTRERELLMKTAVSRTIMLERHERCAELFASITRARHDMVALLEGRERPHSDSTVAEVLELTDRVATVTRERELLMKTAVLRKIMMERQERCAELFASTTRARHDMVALLEGRERPHSDSTVAEVLELTVRVATLTRERELLMKTAWSRTIMLERHERCAELFASITRARHDMMALLEGRELPHSDSTVAEANLRSTLSPAVMKAAETYSELRSDRERIMQLTDVVASQNQQLQRERRVRNQLEQRRAILERLFLNRATSTPYIPAENVATYLGASSYMTNNVFDNPA